MGRTVAPRKEKSRVGEITRYLATLPRCYFEKTSPGPWGRQGRLDITGALFGFRFEIEVKRDGTNPTPLQTETLRRWNDAGALAFVATGIDEVRDAFNPVLEYICERCKGIGCKDCGYLGLRGLWQYRVLSSRSVRDVHGNSV